MRTSLATLFVIAAGLLVLTSGQAVAAAKHESAKTVTIAMHDPAVTGSRSAASSSRRSPSRGRSRSRTTTKRRIKVAGPSGIKRDPVGKKITLQRGIYKITMVGQAPDDNTLKLTVT